MPFGEAVGEGFVNPGVFTRIVIDGPTQQFLIYSGLPAAGNLIASSVQTSGVDGKGNHFIGPGWASYSASAASVVQAGSFDFYTGSLAAGWTFASQIIISLIDGHIILNGNSEIAGNLTVDSNLTVTGTLTVGGSTSTGVPSINATSNVGLANGQISGTSGPASAGTAHNHTAGGYAVTDGHHAHDLQNHLHVL